MNEIKTICICGGGSLGHVVTGYIAATQPNLSVNVLTNRPSCWDDRLSIHLPDTEQITGKLAKVSDNPADVVATADVVLLCLPAFAIKVELERIKPFVKDGAYVGGIFCSTGFFFEALKIFGQNVKLWGFQRVPFIARTLVYGHSANLLGYKSEYKIAVEHATDDEKEYFRKWTEITFSKPTVLLNNYLEASITNSNPLLHTSRLYAMFKDWHKGITYPRNYGFYEEWTEEAAELYIKMDKELFQLIEVLPVSKDFLMPALEYYESNDAASLTQKIRSIEGFKGIKSPMKEIERGKWIPDFENRYFTEDFGFSLRYIFELIKKQTIYAPTINLIFEWGENKI